VLTICTAISPSAQAQGFGINKLKVQLSQKLPPALYPVGTDLLVDISSQAKVAPQYLQRLQDSLEASLPRYDWRLNIVSRKPETVLSCDLFNLNASTRQGVDTRNVYKKTGEHTVTDTNTGITQTVEDYGYVTENVAVTILEGSATAEVAVRDELTGRMLEVRTITAEFRQNYESRPPGLDVAYQGVIDNLVRQIAARFMPTFNSPILVNLPKGELKEASEYLQNGLWNSALASLKTVKPFKKAEDDAYRLYALGVAYEGLAYESPDLASSKYYLEQANHYYDDASQKNYLEADIQNAAYRVSRLLPSYKRFESAITAYERSRQQKGLKAVEAQKIQSYFGTSRVVTNDTIIGWARSGVSEKDIARRIEVAPAKYFDLSASAINDLTSAGVRPSVIDACRRAMIPNQYSRRLNRQWVGTTVAYALAFYPLLFIR
jgi:hypothetical protein